MNVISHLQLLLRVEIDIYLPAVIYLYHLAHLLVSCAVAIGQKGGDGRTIFILHRGIYREYFNLCDAALLGY